jgi:hypothetical protein
MLTKVPYFNIRIYTPVSGQILPHIAIDYWLYEHLPLLGNRRNNRAHNNRRTSGAVFSMSSLRSLQNKVLRTNGNFPRRTPVRKLRKAFNIPYIYDYIIKLCRQQAEVIQNHENVNGRNIGQGEAQHTKHKRLKLGGGQAYDRSSD